MSLMSSPDSATIGAMSWHMSYAPAVGSAFKEWYARISTEHYSRYSVRPNPGPKTTLNNCIESPRRKIRPKVKLALLRAHAAKA